MIRVRTELYHKPISVESPGQGALSNRERELKKKPETSEDELLKLLSRGAEFQLESRPDPKQSELSKKPRTGAITTQTGCLLPISKAKAPLPRPRPGNHKPTLLESSEELFCIC